jgi:hypothetical protein
MEEVEKVAKVKEVEEKVMGRAVVRVAGSVVEEKVMGRAVVMAAGSAVMAAALVTAVELVAVEMG